MNNPNQAIAAHDTIISGGLQNQVFNKKRTCHSLYPHWEQTDYIIRVEDDEDSGLRHMKLFWKYKNSGREKSKH